MAAPPPPPPARRVALPGFVPRAPGAAPPSGGPTSPAPAPGAVRPSAMLASPPGGAAAAPRPPAPLQKQGSVGTGIGAAAAPSGAPAVQTVQKPVNTGAPRPGGAALAVPGKFDPRRPSAETRKVDPRGSIMPGKTGPLINVAEAKKAATATATPSGPVATGRGPASLLGAGASGSGSVAPVGNTVLANALKNLKSAAAGREEVDKAVATLGKLASGSRAAAKKLSQNKDTIRTLLDSMRTRPKFAKMVEYSLECLKNLAVDENSIEELIDEGVLDVILMVRKLNPYNERIAHLTNLTLQAFAINERLAALIADKIGPDLHLFSLKKHVEPQTLISTGNAMHKLMRYQNNVHMYVKAGAIPDMAAVCKANVSKPEVVASMAQALVRVAAAKPEYAAEIIKHGAVEAILSCLGKHPEMAGLVEHATALVGQMARWGPQLVEALRKMGAVDVLVAAVEMHPNNKVIEALAAQCFKLLSGKEDIGVALVKVAKSTANTFDLAAALGKISSLLLVDENVDYLVKNHGVGALMAALQHAVGDQSEIANKILESGCRALMRCAKDENAIYDILSKGGVQLMLNILATHGKEEKVAAAALACLAKLCSRKENAIYLAQSGAIQAAIKALKDHPNSLDVARAVLALISSMSRYPECVQALVNAGALEAIIQINKNFGSDPEIAKECMEVLSRLAITKDNMLKLAAVGGLQAMCETLTKHVQNADVAKSTILLIESAAHVQQNLEQLRKLNAVAAVLQAMAANRPDATLQALGNRCLERLAGKGQVKEAVDHLGVLIRECTSAEMSLMSSDNLFNAVKLISNLTFQEGAMAQLQQAGALDALVSALAAGLKLQAGDQRSAIFTMAAKAIAAFVRDAGAAATFVKSGGVANLLKSCLADIENEELAENAMEVAMRCASDPKNVAKMIADGAVEDIVALMKAFPFNEKLQLNALKALAALCATPEGAKRFMAAGGADVLVEALRNNMDDPVACKLALDLITALATDDEAVAKLLAAGAIDAILAAMRKYAANADILSSCIKALCALMINEKVGLEIGDKGGIPLLVGAMRTHYTTESLVELAIIACDSLVSVPLNVPKFLNKELATVDMVKWTAGAYAANKNIKEGAARILAVLEAVIAKEKAKEEKVQAVAQIEAFDDSACDLLIRQLGTETDPDKIKMLCNQILLLAQDPKNAEMLLAKGGLKALAKVLKQFQNNENVFYPASDAFMALCDASGENAGVLLEDVVCIEALSEMMAVRPTFTKQLDPVLLQRVLTASAKMKLKKPETVQQLLNQHVLESLLKLISVQDNPVVLSQAAKLLAKMSNNEKVAQILAKMANIRELIAAMRKHFKNEEFLRYGVFLLGNLAQNEDLKAQIGIEGGIQLIIQILEVYATNEGLCENCCYAMANLSFNNEVNMSFIVACKGIQHILTTLKNHPKRVELLEPAVCTLCNLCHKNDPNKDAICKAGGAQGIVDCILNNFNAIDLVLTGFRTLGNLAYSAATISTIIKAGGVQGIVAGMTVHAEELDVIDIAIRVLTNLASDLDDENMKIMAEEGAVQAIVEVAHKFAANLDLEIAALGCLCNLAREPINASMIIRQNGTEALVAAMNGLQFDPELVEKAMRLLAVLAVSDGNQDKVIDAKAVTAAVAAMKTHNKNKVILSNGLKAISLLAYSDAVATKMASEGPITFILGLINDSMQEPPLMAECFQPLAALSRSEVNAWSMAETAMKTVNTALNQHPQEMKFHTAAFGFLAALCVHSRAAEAVIPTNMVQAVLTSLKTFKLDPPLLIRGLRALENIAFSTQPVRDHMREKHVIEACIDIKDRHSVRDDVVKQCQAVVDAITRTKTDLSASPFLSLLPKERKTAKELFGEIKQITVVQELEKHHKNLLMAGALLYKHSVKAAPRPRHIYVTPDLKWLVWKDPKEAVDPKQRMKTFKIRSVERGRCTPQLQRKKTFGGFYAKEECSFAIMGRERTVDLEAQSEAEREKWVLAVQALVGYLKALKQQAQKFTSR